MYLKIVFTNNMLLKNNFKLFLVACKVIFRHSNTLAFYKEKKYIDVHVSTVRSRAKTYCSHK